MLVCGSAVIPSEEEQGMLVFLFLTLGFCNQSSGALRFTLEFLWNSFGKIL